MNTRYCIFTLFGLLTAASSLYADKLPKDAIVRSAAVEGIRNEQAGFVVRVDVDHRDGIYSAGDTLQATVRSGRDGHLYLLYTNAEGKTTCLFPNRFQSNNRIQANQAITVPSAEADFRIRISQPVGREVLKAIVSAKPVSALDLGVPTLDEGACKGVGSDHVRSAIVELNQQDRKRDWAEHQVELTTVTGQKPEHRQSRYGVIVALADYQDSRIPKLPACAKDAALMKQLFDKSGHMDDIVVLQDKDATRANIEKLFRVLAQGTKPGDEIFIYWSGHGASVADTSGDESDGMDEVLVTYDISRDDVANTGVLDDVLRRWVQDLDGRRLVFIADTCLAGGFAGTGKGVTTKSLFSDLKGGQDNVPQTKSTFDFFDTEFAQTKDIGQKETAVLSSSADKEASLVRRDGNSSVMTGFLVDFVNGKNGSVPLGDAADYVKREVPKYVHEHMPGMNQEPQFLNNLSSPIFLRP